jgi:HAD superfamily hydrolase (TIGR01509 family)
MSIAAVIFDFDGLILDSETPLFDIWTAIYARHGQALALDEWQHALGTQGGFDPFDTLAARVGEVLDRDELSAWVRREHWRRCGEQPLLPGVRDRLCDARRIGLKTAVASSSSAAWVDPWLGMHELRPLVDVVCTRDDVARVKPAPDLFLLAAERLHVDAAACLVFEDSPNGIRAARAAGMAVIAVPNRLTAPLPLPDPDLVLHSLADAPLEDLVSRVEAIGS